jgi:hypothetical protein
MTKSTINVYQMLDGGELQRRAEAIGRALLDGCDLRPADASVAVGSDGTLRLTSARAASGGAPLLAERDAQGALRERLARINDAWAAIPIETGRGLPALFPPGVDVDSVQALGDGGWEVNLAVRLRPARGEAWATVQRARMAVTLDADGGVRSLETNWRPIESVKRVPRFPFLLGARRGRAVAVVDFDGRNRAARGGDTVRIGYVYAGRQRLVAPCYFYEGSDKTACVPASRYSFLIDG